MVTLLLIIIYLAFIGLGLPDALLGSAWSVMKHDIHATTEMAGYISLIISFSTVVSSLSASRLLHRFGTVKSHCSVYSQQRSRCWDSHSLRILCFY